MHKLHKIYINQALITTNKIINKIDECVGYRVWQGDFGDRIIPNSQALHTIRYTTPVAALFSPPQYRYPAELKLIFCTTGFAMRIFFHGFEQLLKYLRSLAILSLLCLLLSWSFPAQAATRISPQLEQQVMQIIREHPEVLIESVQAYQQQQQRQLQQSQLAFLQDLQTNPQVVIGNSPVTGSPNSKIVLVEFSDFECPYCAEANKTLKNFMAKHQDEVTLVYKHFPLTPIHNQAMPAAKAAFAANQQGKFWEYSDALFSNQKQLGEALYLDIATNLKLDLDKFKSDRALADNAIAQDMQLAQKLGITGTPFFVMNGETFSGAVQLSDMEKVLARATQ